MPLPTKNQKKPTRRDFPSYLDVQAKKRLRNRLSRVEGQIRALKTMVDEGRCADDILIQASAVRGAIGQFIARILEAHLSDCVATCMGGSERERTERLAKAVALALKPWH
jgi:DNA-binding FrmR family transcriptional regulator